MAKRIPLLHPEGKKGITMDMDKYMVLKEAILTSLKTSQGFTHKQLLEKVTNSFGMGNVKFAGSVGWHMEWVKLDLEAKGQIRRVGEGPVTYALVV
jgi:hypothetical protein